MFKAIEKKPEEETDAVSSSGRELTDLYKFDLTQNKKSEQVRNLMPIECPILIK